MIRFTPLMAARLALMIGLIAGVYNFSTVTPSYAQDVAAPKIAVLDVPEIERRALVWQDLRVKFKAANEVILNELRQMQASLEEEGKSLQQQQAILSADAFAAKRKEFEERLQLSNKKAAERKQAMEKTLAEAKGKIVGYYREIVGEIATKNGINLILDRSVGDPTVVLATEDIEITDVVIERLDKRVQTIDFTVPPAK
ncbi:MAG: OmpH family outer membrane protein [Alphaproteobacteria bacterium]|nr:OmpH family outer membrane protein [Alphaproteobacteria bacterium]